jgi:hypothetical protein
MSSYSGSLTPPRSSIPRHEKVELSLNLTHLKEEDPRAWHKEVMRASGMVEEFATEKFVVLSRFFSDFVERMQTFLKSALVQNQFGHEIAFMPYVPTEMVTAPSEVLFSGGSPAESDPVYSYIGVKEAPFAFHTPFTSNPIGMFSDASYSKVYCKQGYISVADPEDMPQQLENTRTFMVSFFSQICGLNVLTRVHSVDHYDFCVWGPEKLSVTIGVAKRSLRHFHVLKWGISSRIFDMIIKTHSDNHGLRFPPLLAPHQVIIMNEMKNMSPMKETYLNTVVDTLRKDTSFRKIYLSILIETKTTPPEERRIYWRRRGIPIVLVLNRESFLKNSVYLHRRDRMHEARTKVPVIGLEQSIKRILYEIEESYKIAAASSGV